MVWRKGARLRFGDPKKMAVSVRSISYFRPHQKIPEKNMGAFNSNTAGHGDSTAWSISSPIGHGRAQQRRLGGMRQGWERTKQDTTLCKEEKKLST